MDNSNNSNSNQSSHYKIKCLQINLQRSKTATGHLTKFVEEKKIDVLLIQEPYYIDNKVSGFPMSFTVLQTYNNCIPKAAIVITNKNIRYIEFITYSSDIMVAANIYVEDKTYLLISLYCSPFNNLQIELDFLSNCLNTLKPENLIISTDSNAKSRVWFSERDDSRGNTINEFVNERNLIIINDNEFTPTYYSTHGKSFIDLTISNLNASNYIYEWEVLLSDSLSDHRYIYFTLTGRVLDKESNNTRKYITKNFDWNLFENELNLHIPDIHGKLDNCNDAENVSEIAKLITAIITDTCNKFMKISKNNNYNKSNKWWNNELTAKRLELNRARRKFQRNFSQNREVLKESYKVIKSQYKKLIIKSKISSFNEFIQNNTRENPFGVIYKISRNKINPLHNNELINSDGNVITDANQIAVQLLHTLCPDNESNSEELVSMNEAMTVDNYLCPDDIPFIEEEVTEIIDKQNANKAPGIDGLSADIIQKFHYIDKSVLLKLYNKCLFFGVFPEIWKHSVIKVLYKGCGKDRRDAKSYRPISLISIMGKVLEKLLINRLMFSLNKRNKLSSNQYGFTPQKSTEDLLIEIKQEIEETFEAKEFCLILGFDIEGAFNNLLWHNTISELKEKKCEKNLVNLSISYFMNRSAEIWINTAKVAKSLTKGCPQGSACGPGFWNINYDSLLKLTFEERCKLKGFADDTLAIIRAKTIEELESKANKTIEKILDLGSKQKLKFNAEKTTAVLFTNNLKHDKLNVTMNGVSLDLKNSFKYLGVIIDNKLRFTQHISYLKGKVIGITMNLLRLVKNNFGLNNNFLSIIYKAVIQPIVAYGCAIWFGKVDQILFRTTLNQIQRLMAIRCCSGYRTIASDAAGILANFLPLDLYIKQRAIEFHLKRGLHNTKADQILESIAIIKDNYQKPVNYRDKPHPALRKSIAIIDNYDSDIQIFTDASKSERGVGAAFCVFRGNTVIKKSKHKLSSWCTVFQSQCYAIREAIKYFNTTNYSTSTFNTDSLSALLAMKQRDSNTKLIHEIYEEIENSISQNKKCFFKWTPSHESNDGNNLADSLAKQASKSHQSYSYDLYPYSYAKRLLKDYFVNEWNERWISSNTGSNTRKFFPTVYDRHHCRKYFSTNFYITQIITNHGKFNQYLERFKLRDKYECECDGITALTSDHLLFECPLLDNKRNTLKEKVIEIYGTFQCNHSQMIDYRIFKHFTNFCVQVFN
jgi:ribonuclease HI